METYDLATSLQALSACCRSFLGPEPATKCVVSHPGDVGADSKSVMVDTCTGLLHAMDGEPTATTLLLEALEAQEATAGSGGTWLVVLVGLLVGKLTELSSPAHQNGVMHLTWLMDGLSHGIEICQKVASTYTLPLTDLTSHRPLTSTRDAWVSQGHAFQHQQQERPPHAQLQHHHPYQQQQQQTDQQCQQLQQQRRWQQGTQAQHQWPQATQTQEHLQQGAQPHEQESCGLTSRQVAAAEQLDSASHEGGRKLEFVREALGSTRVEGNVSEEEEEEDEFAWFFGKEDAEETGGKAGSEGSQADTKDKEPVSGDQGCADLGGMGDGTGSTKEGGKVGSPEGNWFDRQLDSQQRQACHEEQQLNLHWRLQLKGCHQQHEMYQHEMYQQQQQQQQQGDNIQQHQMRYRQQQLYQQQHLDQHHQPHREQQFKHQQPYQQQHHEQQSKHNQPHRQSSPSLLECTAQCLAHGRVDEMQLAAAALTLLITQPYTLGTYASLSSNDANSCTHVSLSNTNTNSNTHATLNSTNANRSTSSMGSGSLAISGSMRSLCTTHHMGIVGGSNTSVQDPCSIPAPANRPSPSTNHDPTYPQCNQPLAYDHTSTPTLGSSQLLHIRSHASAGMQLTPPPPQHTAATQKKDPHLFPQPTFTPSHLAPSLFPQPVQHTCMEQQMQHECDQPPYRPQLLHQRHEQHSQVLPQQQPHHHPQVLNQQHVHEQHQTPHHPRVLHPQQHPHAGHFLLHHQQQVCSARCSSIRTSTHVHVLQLLGPGKGSSWVVQGVCVPLGAGSGVCVSGGDVSSLGELLCSKGKAVWRCEAGAVDMAGQHAAALPAADKLRGCVGQASSFLGRTAAPRRAAQLSVLFLEGGLGVLNLAALGAGSKPLQEQKHQYSCHLQQQQEGQEEHPRQQQHLSNKEVRLQKQCQQQQQQESTTQQQKSKTAQGTQGLKKGFLSSKPTPHSQPPSLPHAINLPSAHTHPTPTSSSHAARQHSFKATTAHMQAQHHVVNSTSTSLASKHHAAPKALFDASNLTGSRPTSVITHPAQMYSLEEGPWLEQAAAAVLAALAPLQVDLVLAGGHVDPKLVAMLQSPPPQCCPSKNSQQAISAPQTPQATPSAPSPHQALAPDASGSNTQGLCRAPQATPSASSPYQASASHPTGSLERTSVSGTSNRNAGVLVVSSVPQHVLRTAAATCRAIPAPHLTAAAAPATAAAAAASAAGSSSDCASAAAPQPDLDLPCVARGVRVSLFNNGYLVGRAGAGGGEPSASLVNTSSSSSTGGVLLNSHCPPTPMLLLEPEACVHGTHSQHQSTHYQPHTSTRPQQHQPIHSQPHTLVRPQPHQPRQTHTSQPVGTLPRTFTSTSMLPQSHPQQQPAQMHMQPKPPPQCPTHTHKQPTPRPQLPSHMPTQSKPHPQQSPQVPTLQPVTILLHAPTSASLASSATATASCLNRLRAVLALGQVLPGGGVFELLCARVLHAAAAEAASSTNGRTAGELKQTAQWTHKWQRLNLLLAEDARQAQAAALESLACCMEDMVAILLQNRGCGFSDVLERLGKATPLLSPLSEHMVFSQPGKHLKDDVYLPSSPVLLDVAKAVQSALHGDEAQRHKHHQISMLAAFEGPRSLLEFVGDDGHARSAALGAVESLARLFLLPDTCVINHLD